MNNFKFSEDVICTDNKAASREFAKSSVIIAENCRYSLNDVKTRLNNNILVTGGSGTGKTSTIVVPNILQAVGSYIVSDPKGNLCRKYGNYLREKGYNVVNIDLTAPERSTRYNPLKFVTVPQDIMKITNIIVDRKASERSTADPFWDSMTTILLSSIIGYMIETQYTPFNFSGILKLVREGERGVSDDDNEYKSSKLFRRFKVLNSKSPDSWACGQFENVNAAPNKTYDTIRSTLVAKFSNFDTPELQKMMSANDFAFRNIGSEKTAVFVTVSDTDRSMDALANIFFTQAMQELCRFADEQPDSRLPVPVRFFLDDFATNCKIEEFPRMISTIRSRGISVMLMIQAESQLINGYGSDCATIIANCDTYVYLGGNDFNTAESIAMRCNKPVQQILYMPVGNCWVFRRGSQPVYTRTVLPSARTKDTRSNK